MKPPPKRYHTEAEIIAEIDRLRDEIPALTEKSRETERRRLNYLLGINEHVEAYRLSKSCDANKDPWQIYKKLKRAAKGAANKLPRQEKKIAALGELLSEFRTQTMPFLADGSVVEK